MLLKKLYTNFAPDRGNLPCSKKTTKKRVNFAPRSSQVF